MSTERETGETIGKLTIQFKRGLRSDGEITRVTLNQLGGHIDLSADQARSLAAVLKAKLGG